MRYAYCTPGRIRTFNPRNRNPIFYPVELRVQLSAKSNKLYQLVFDIGYKNKLCDFKRRQLA